MGNEDEITLGDEAMQAFYFDACAGDYEVARQLVDMYLASADDLVAQMQEGIAQGDLSLLYRASHTLKSSSRIFGAKQISDVCEEVETRVQSQVVDGASELVATIARRSQRMHELLPAACRRLAEGGAAGG